MIIQVNKAVYVLFHLFTEPYFNLILILPTIEKTRRVVSFFIQIWKLISR